MIQFHPHFTNNFYCNIINVRICIYLRNCFIKSLHFIFIPENQFHLFSAPHNVVHSDWLSTLKYSAVDGKEIFPDCSSKLVIHIVMVTLVVVLSLEAEEIILV